MLTNEEKEVLILLGQGETQKYIGEKMKISNYRLHRIRDSFVKKLEARNQVHAVYLALSQGLIEIPD